MIAVEALGIADVVGDFVTRPLDLAVLSFAGLEGDRHAGLTQRSGVRQKHLPKGTEIRNARQLSLVSVEELAKIAAFLGLAHVDYRWLGANVLLRGAPDLTRWAPGSRLVFGSGAVLVIDGENEPCRKAGRAISELAPRGKGSELAPRGKGSELAPRGKGSELAPREGGAAEVEAGGGLASRFVKAAHRLRGVVAWVERPGTIRCGDPVTLVSR